MKNSLKTDILILGAGIGGYESYRTLTKLLKRKGLNKKITIVDRNNYFTFAPMLHEVVSGAVEPTHAAFPIREVVYNTPHEFINGEITKIDPEKRIVDTSEGMIQYDYCVVALGSTVKYYNTPGAEKYSYTVRTLVEALRLKQRILGELEDRSEREIYMTIVGGGLTGVEMAGQLAYLADTDLKKLYPKEHIHINLVQSGPTILPFLPATIQKHVQKKLESWGVHFYIDNAVKEVGKDAVVLKDGVELKSTVTIWTAGFQNVAPKFLDASYCKDERIPVNNHLHHINDAHLYAAGDIALIYPLNSEIPYAQIGEAAHHEGRYAARHIVASIRKKNIKPFHFKSAGTLMPIGDWYGAAKIGNIIFFGRFAWWLRRTAYLVFMPGFTRKLRIVFDWTIHSFAFRHIINVK